MAVQPAGMLNDYGVILTIGVVNYADRSAIVIPLGTDDTAILDSERCYDVVASFLAQVMSSFTPILGNTAYVSFLQAEGMIDGMTPYREDYAAATYDGTGGSPALPSNVTGLIAYYEDPDDSPTGERVRVGKNFIPAVPSSLISGDIIDPTLVAAYLTFGDLLQEGFDSTAGSGYKYYRVLATPTDRTAGSPLIRTINARPRGYVCTQRRRLTPRA